MAATLGRAREALALTQRFYFFPKLRRCLRMYDDLLNDLRQINRWGKEPKVRVVYLREMMSIEIGQSVRLIVGREDCTNLTLARV